ncbi:MAG: response regulator [Flavobacteriales bacterium]|nr:response regulator [Flavobacteriales bacterium]
MQKEKLTIGIVEDDMIIAGALSEMLAEIGYHVPDNATRYSEAIEMIEQERPDLLLLDIHLVGQMDGIDLAETVRKKFQIPFIFLTANLDSATVDRAKKVHPAAYLAKPVTKDQLYSAIEIAFSNFNGAKPSGEPKAESSMAKKDSVFVKDGHSFRKVYYHELLYLESEANYVALHLSTGKKILIRSSLDDFIHQLDPALFIRVHRGYAVNTEMIDGVFPTEVSVKGVKIPVGRTHKVELLARLGIAE